MSIIKKNGIMWQRGYKETGIYYITDRNVKWYSHCGKHFGSFFKIFIYLLFGCIKSWLQHVGSSLRHAGSFIAACGLFVAAHGLLSSCGVQALEHAGSVVEAHSLSSCGTRASEHAGSGAVACGLSSCGAWALECLGSVVAVLGLSCSATCVILVPWPGIEPTSPALEGGFLTTGPPGKSQAVS